MNTIARLTRRQFVRYYMCAENKKPETIEKPPSLINEIL